MIHEEDMRLRFEFQRQNRRSSRPFRDRVSASDIVDFQRAIKLLNGLNVIHFQIVCEPRNRASSSKRSILNSELASYLRMFVVHNKFVEEVGIFNEVNATCFKANSQSR